MTQFGTLNRNNILKCNILRNILSQSKMLLFCEFPQLMSLRSTTKIMLIYETLKMRSLRQIVPLKRWHCHKNVINFGKLHKLVVAVQCAVGGLKTAGSFLQEVLSLSKANVRNCKIQINGQAIKNVALISKNGKRTRVIFVLKTI